MKLFIFSIACFYMLSFSSGSSDSIPKVRAVSLGGWLVTEGWIKPSLFDGIPNKDFMDGTQMQLKSVKLGMYLSAESGENDFDFIKKSGLNTVRLPVGWWIAHDPHPPKLFVGGSIEFVNKAFSWAKKYGIKVILDLHAVPGSQNGWEHSGTRDGFQEWGHTYDTIQQTVDVIDFLTARYARSPSLFGMAVLNEPFAPIVSVQNLTKFYKASYEVVRKHLSTAYFILANRLGPQEPRELFDLAKTMTKAVIEVHYYSLFNEIYTNLTVQQNIDYIYNNRTKDLDYLTVPNGPLIFVGEWIAEMLVNTTKREYQIYAEAQQHVYGKTTFGWAFWTLKNVKNRWSLEWLIKNGYIKI
ncbi:hypothetical protein C2S52_006261 [Perilla frutescens var. hirtella]|nr:hypothetical protein C2S52_006261 [Perilla frutescens var. hirtella]